MKYIILIKKKLWPFIQFDELAAFPLVGDIGADPVKYFGRLLLRIPDISSAVPDVRIRHLPVTK